MDPLTSSMSHLTESQRQALLEEQRIVQELLDREEAAYKFDAFARYVGGVVPARHHRIICDAIQRVIEGTCKRLIINSPPGSAKSTYTSLLMPAFALGYHPKHKIIGCSHTQELADDFGRKVRGVLETAEYSNVFQRTLLSTDSRAADRWSTTTGGSYLAAGVGAGIAGYRGSILLIDDPYRTRADANSATVRNKVLDWFYNDAKTRLFPGGAIVLIQTRWHPEDLAGTLIQKSLDGSGDPYEVISFQAIYEDGPDPLGRQVGEPLWPEWQPLDELLGIKRDMKPLDWLSLYQQKPMDPEGNVVQRSWFGEYTYLNPEDLKKMIIVASWDTAGVVNEKADYTVGTIWAINMSGDFYLLDMYRKQVDFTVLEKEVYAFSKRWNANFVLIEDRGTGTSLLQKYKGMPINIVKISPAAIGDKEFRFDKASSTIESGKIMLPKTSSFVGDFVAELLQFPFGKYRDICDSFSQVVNWYNARQQRRGMIKAPTY